MPPETLKPCRATRAEQRGGVANPLIRSRERTERAPSGPRVRPEGGAPLVGLGPVWCDRVRSRVVRPLVNGGIRSVYSSERGEGGKSCQIDQGRERRDDEERG
jgi:hypothetical protein